MTKHSDIIPGRSIYVVGGAYGYLSWMQASRAATMEDATAVCFSGGEDCGPSLYGAMAHPTTWANPHRDREEVAAFKKALALGKPLIGVCRGHQFLTVMAGGKLVQDQTSSSGWHPMHTIDGRVIKVTSCHHQAAWPWNLAADQFKVLGWTTSESPYHYGESYADEMVIGKVLGNIEVEEIHLPGIRAAGFQHHPEFRYHDYGRNAEVTTYIDHCRSILDRHLAGTL